MKKHIFFKLLSVVAILCTTLALILTLGVGASAEGTVREVGTEAELVAALAAGGDVQLTADINLTATGTINVSANTTLSSKTGEGPYAITRSQKTGFSMLTVNSGVTLTLTNITLDGGEYADATTIGGAIANKGTVILETGATIQNFCAKRGGAISGGYIAIMPGSLITGNSTNDGGSAILGSNTWMVGGTIENNSSTGTEGYTGTILIDSWGKFTMRGGVIQNNTAVAGASVIDCVGNGCLYMIGGSIINNSSSAASSNAPACAFFFRNATSNWSGFMLGNDLTTNQPAVVSGIGSQSSIQIHSNGTTMSYGLNSKYTIDLTCRIKASGIPEGSRYDYTYATIVDPTTGTKYYHADLLSAATHASTLEGASVQVTRFDEGVATLPANGSVSDFSESGETNVSFAFTAENGNSATVTIPGNFVAMRDGLLYNTLAGAVAANTQGPIVLKYIKLDAGTVKLPVGTYTIDGEGKTFYRATAGVPMFTLSKGTNVTFTNITLDGSPITADTVNGTAFAVVEGSTLTLANKAVVQNFTGGDYGATINVKGTLTLKDDAKVIDNLSAGGRGAAIYVGWGTLLIQDNALISGNRFSHNGTAYGAAIFAESSTVVMTGGRITNNGHCDANAWQFGSAISANRTSKLWLLGGEISENKISLRGAVHLSEDGCVLYLMGTDILDNVASSSNGDVAVYAPAILVAKGNAYLLGGQIKGNKIGENNQGKTPTAAIVAESTGYIHIASSVEVASVPAAVANSGLVTVSGTTVTSKTPLEIYDNTDNWKSKYGSGRLANVKIDNVTLEGDLVAGSRIDFEDVAIPLGEGFKPNESTVNAVRLYGADALYRPTVSEGKLVWPEEAYQIYQSAALTESISFRVIFARRSAKADILSDVTVEQVTKAQNKETAAWESKAVNAEWKQDVYNGSPCIVVSLAPKMAMDQIIVKKGGESVKAEGYTFASYLEGMKEDETYSANAKLMALVDATLNYCAAAQTYFGYNNAVLANANVTTKVDLVPEVSMTLDDPNKVFHSAQVDVASTVSVAIIAKGNVTATVTVGTTDVTPEYRDLKDAEGETYTAIIIPNLAAAVLKEQITVKIGDATLTYSVPAYAYNMQKKSDDTTLVGVVQALYAYAVAAAEYAK